MRSKNIKVMAEKKLPTLCRLDDANLRSRCLPPPLPDSCFCIVVKALREIQLGVPVFECVCVRVSK